MVWSHISDGFQQDSATSDGLGPSALQKTERTSKSVMTSYLDMLSLTWDEALDLTNGMERLYCPMCTRKV